MTRMILVIALPMATMVLAGCGGSGASSGPANFNSFDLTDIYSGNSRVQVSAYCDSTGCTIDGSRFSNAEIRAALLRDLAGVPEFTPQPYLSVNGVKIRRIYSPSRVYVPETGITYREVDLLGAVLEYSVFQSAYINSYGQGLSLNGRYGISAGTRTGTQPVHGTWTGAYVGTHPTQGPLVGDVQIRVVSRNRISVDFENIRDGGNDYWTGFDPVEFPSVAVSSNGDFTARIEDETISGSFYGPRHAEAAGVYVWESGASGEITVPGAFGATR